MRIPHTALRSRITIERYLGQGARGPTFAAPETNVPASAQSIENLRVEWKDEEVLVQIMLLTRPEVGRIPLGSRVTLDGDVYRVVKAVPIPDYHHPSHIEHSLMTWGSQ